MRNPLRRKDNDVANQPADDAAPAGSLEDLEKRVNKLQQDLTKRINDLNTGLTNRVNEIDTKAGNAVNAVSNLKTKVENNESSIAAFQGTLDTLTTDVGAAKSSISVLADRMDHLEELQGSLNTAFSKAIQQNRDFTLEQYKSAKDYTEKLTKKLYDQVQAAKSELDTKIQTLADAPVKPHQHTVHLTGETENPGVDTGAVA